VEGLKSGFESPYTKKRLKLTCVKCGDMIIINQPVEQSDAQCRKCKQWNYDAWIELVE